MQNLASGVDNVLLNNIMLVTSPANSVSVALSKSSVYPPTVRQTRWFSVLCGLISATIRLYVTVLTFDTLPLSMKKIVLSPFGMRVLVPWDSLPRSLMNSFIQIYASGPCQNLSYSCNIPMMGFITALAFNWMHAVRAVRICVAREYLEAVLSILGC